MKPILSRHKIKGSYPPPHSCGESVKKAGDDVVDAIKTYEAILSERAYLKSEVDYGCTKKRMGIFSITREIIKKSMDEEKENSGDAVSLTKREKIQEDDFEDDGFEDWKQTMFQKAVDNGFTQYKKYLKVN